MQTEPNGTQDKIGQHTSDKPKKSKKKKNLIILGTVIIIVIFLLLFIQANTGITPKRAMIVRCNAMCEWYKYVQLYIEENNMLPNSLFEVCEDANSRGRPPIPPYLIISNDVNYPMLTIMDPDVFEKEVPFGLFTSGSEKWFIRELVPGRFYTKMLMIDQDGNIYELNEIPKKKYEYKY